MIQHSDSNPNPAAPNPAANPNPTSVPNPAGNPKSGTGADFVRLVPELPPVGRSIRLLIDSDTANEVDDQYAIALALLSPERFRIEGFVATHFGDSGGPRGTDRSYDEILALLDAAGMAGRFPVKKGGDPLLYSSCPQESEGADFIIERAMAGTKDDPLWVVGLGAATNIASAYLKEPRIAERVVVLWHGRTGGWPKTAWNFNIYNDLRAVRVIFTSTLPFVLFDTGTDLTCPMEECRQKIRPCGKLGQFLHDIRLRKAHFQSESKGMFDLGDIAWMIDPSLCTVEEADAPWLDWNMAYKWDRTYGRLVRVMTVDRDGTFGLLERKLAQQFPPAGG